MTYEEKCQQNLATALYEFINDRLSHDQVMWIIDDLIDAKLERYYEENNTRKA